MGRIFGLILFVTAIYIAVTLYSEGVEGAFGGILAPAGQSASEAEEGGPRPAKPITQRVRERVEEDLRMGARRLDQLDE